MAGPDGSWQMPEMANDPQAFLQWQHQARQQLSRMLGIPETCVPLDSERRGELELDDIIIEKWVYTSEPGSRVPALVYRPREVSGRLPGIVLTFGHGGCKGHQSYQYLGQLYARLGFVVLSADPIGEEERHIHGKLATQAHDPESVHRKAWEAGRSIMGKLVFDSMRGVDFLLSRDDIDPRRVGVSGNSLGGAKAGWMAALDSRLSFAIVSGWGFDDSLATKKGKFCTRIPNMHLREQLTWEEFLSLAVPHCQVLITNGDADVIIDIVGKGGPVWSRTREIANHVGSIYAKFGQPRGIATWFESDGGHRLYPAHPEVVRELLRMAGVAPNSSNSTLVPLNFGEWCDRHSVSLGKLYGTQLHYRGCTVVERDVQYLPPKLLAVLTPEEVGSDEFTLEGWLAFVSIDRNPF